MSITQPIPFPRPIRGNLSVGGGPRHPIRCRPGRAQRFQVYGGTPNTPYRGAYTHVQSSRELEPSSGPVSICLENIKDGAQNTLLPCSACAAEFDHDGLLIAAFRSRARLENPGAGAA